MYHKPLMKFVIVFILLALLLVSISIAKSKDNDTGTRHADEQALVQDMVNLIQKISIKRAGDQTVKRFNQAKSLGCFSTQFTVHDDIPERFKQGVFAQPKTYDGLVRFANASTFDDGEKDLRGLSIKLSGVEGQSLLANPGIQDFVLNSHPVLFAATPEDFLSFIKAQDEDNIFWYFFNPTDSHLKSLYILLKARDKPNSPFDIRYWSTTPYQLGKNNKPIKYSVKSCASIKSDDPEEYHQNYLREAMHKHLQQTPVCFDFMLQEQTNNDDMPIEDTSVLWDEDESPFIKVASFSFIQQEFMSKKALNECEKVDFNPWHTIAEHKPLGRMNYVRKEIYIELSKFRREQNNP